MFKNKDALLSDISYALKVMGDDSNKCKQQLWNIYVWFKCKENQVEIPLYLAFDYIMNGVVHLEMILGDTRHPDGRPRVRNRHSSVSVDISEATGCYLETH